LHGGGLSTRSFIHIRDVAEATWRIAERGTSGETYHISTGKYVSIRELVERICRMMNVAFDAVVETADERPGKDDAYLLNSSKLRGELGWEDRISLEDGLRETLRWIDGNLELLKGRPLDYIHKE
jgi:dTDP-glucose 4,6-dehydratase